MDGYPIVAFAEGEFDLNEISSIEYLTSHLRLLKIYFFCLWLIKDNAADFDVGFLQFRNAVDNHEVSSNNMSNSNFKIDGTRTSTVFTLKGIYGASELLNKDIIINKDKPKFAIASSFNKITIAGYFIQSALTSQDLGIKAVGYCSALETLFSSGDNTELSHKLSERIAKFLGKDLEERKKLYKTVKKIYEIRSKVVHGATYKPNKVESLTEIVQGADEVCRKVITYAYSSENENIFEMNNEALDSFFIELALK